jgi:uncharacterized protein YjiS (DUF1127 family)
MIEGLVISTALLGALLLTRAEPFSMSFARLWIEYQNQERLRCELRHGSNCASRLRQALHQLPWGRIHDDSISKTLGEPHHRINVKGIVQWCNRKKSPCPKYEQLNIEQSLSEKDLLDF